MFSSIELEVQWHWYFMVWKQEAGSSVLEQSSAKTGALSCFTACPCATVAGTWAVLRCGWFLIFEVEFYVHLTVQDSDNENGFANGLVENQVLPCAAKLQV